MAFQEKFHNYVAEKGLLEKYPKNSIYGNINNPTENVNINPTENVNNQEFGFSPNGTSFGAINPNNSFIMPFTNAPLIFNNQYVENESGGVVHQNSSVEQAGKQLSLDEIASKIIADETLKKYASSLTKDDVYFSTDGKMLMLKYHRNNTSDEVFRLDLCGNDILIQAPFETPHSFRAPIIFNHVSVPVNSETGEKILANFGYKVKANDELVFEKCIFREDETSN